MKEKVSKISGNIFFNNTQNQIADNVKTTFKSDVIIQGNLQVENGINFNGPVIIKTVDGGQYNLQTPTDGEIGYVLTTDGSGSTYWSSKGSGSGIVYNGVIPANEGSLLKISNIDGSTANSSKMIETASNLNMNDLNIIGVSELSVNSISSRTPELNISAPNVKIDGFTSLSNLIQGTQIYTTAGVHDLDLDGKLVNIVDAVGSTTLILPSNIQNGYTLIIINMCASTVNIIPKINVTIENTMKYVELKNKLDKIKFTFYNNIWLII
jgi:hypothetical protein